MSPPGVTRRHVRCAIAGGGPAGIMLGYLLARAGVDVVVLEKHGDFFRDFRGDTIHPSTLEVMGELGLLDDFLRLPHQEVARLRVVLGDTPLTLLDFSHLPTRCRFLAFMPQWDFLRFLADRASRYPGFQLELQAEVTDVLTRGDRVVGLRATTPDGELEVTADLTVAADGRFSQVRARAGLVPRDFGVPIDVLWFRLPKAPDPPPPTLFYVGGGELVLTIDRGDYWQSGMLIPKGGFDRIKAEGLPALRERIARPAPFLRAVVGELRDWDQVKLLSVQVNRLRRWYRPGLLCIGDAAHAMSPAFGVGVNYAVQDAVAAANALAARLRDGQVRTEDLRRLQRRRQLPVRLMQPLQVALHRRVTRPGGVLASGASLPAPVRLLGALALPAVRRLAARLVGLGFRPEHVATPEASAARRAAAG